MLEEYLIEASEILIENLTVLTFVKTFKEVENEHFVDFYLFEAVLLKSSRALEFLGLALGLDLVYF